MPEPQRSSQTLTDRERESIEYAKQSLARGEPENKITADVIQGSYPNNSAEGYDYARYILAEARFALDRQQSIHEEQTGMNHDEGDSRNHNSEQYKRDWAYAVRALEKGDAPEKIIKDMAAFHKDLPDAQQYAKTTIAKAQQYLQVRNELSDAARARSIQVPDYTLLDSSFREAGHLEFARHLYEDGARRETVAEFLQKERQLEQPEAADIATKAETRLFAERDLNYAIRARERGEGDELIIPKIAEYRQGAVENPQDYARAIAEAADKVRQLEHDQPLASAQQQIATAQQQFRRDVQFAVFQLEHQTLDEVRHQISERRPDKAYESASFRIHRFPDHSYSVGVAEQALRIREVTERGRGLEETLDVAEREFGRRVQAALNMREAGRTSNEIMKQLSNEAPSNSYYARAAANQADSIREHQRQSSIRPEIAGAVIKPAAPTHERTTSRTTIAIER